MSYRIALKAAPGIAVGVAQLHPRLEERGAGRHHRRVREKVVFPKSINKVITKKHTPWTVRRSRTPSPSHRWAGWLTVRGASGLKNMEMMGTSDPYAALALGSRKTPPLISDCQRTRTIDNTLHPTWEETFELDVCSTELQCLWVRVYDDDGQYGTDDLMGSAVLPLSGLPADGSTVRGSYPLKKEKELQTGGERGKKSGTRHGELFLELTYVPITEPADETRKRLDQATREAEAKYRETPRRVRISGGDLPAARDQGQTRRKGAQRAARIGQRHARPPRRTDACDTWCQRSRRGWTSGTAPLWAAFPGSRACAR